MVVSAWPEAASGRQRIAVVGAGSIGVAWSIVFARAGLGVQLLDQDTARLSTAVAEVHARLRMLHDHGLLDDSIASVEARIAPTSVLADALEGVRHVQECVSERLAVKRELFSRLDAICPDDVVLASSSSAITATKIADSLPGRARCLIVHPGNPPYLLPAVELVPAAFTAEEVVARTRDLLIDVGMAPTVIRSEIEGFAFNRLQGALLREAYCLVRDGIVDVEDVDRLVRDGLGRRWAIMGPFETADLNTRGGLAAHAAILGPSYARMGADRGQYDEWTPELVAEATRQRRKVLPADEWAQRVAWRDEALMDLELARRISPRLTPGTAAEGSPATGSEGAVL